MNFSAAYLQGEQGKKTSAEIISSDDVALFREAMQGVKPLAQNGRIARLDPGRQPISRLPDILTLPNSRNTFSGDLQSDSAEENADWAFARSGLQRNMLRKLRCGNWPVQGELDLHGLNRNEACRLLAVFLDRSVARGFRCMRIIHGRGLGSKNRKPVLKILTGNWLMQHQDVLAFCQALPEHGGSGAVLVLLKNTGK
ncbi:Smr/MutS family protein [Nitrosomonas sp.]|uniref:Smr/MutS family protein n=1 Tax=Nitrosomonas sp. TaxID=42353 RepID=UPI0025FC3412|nr:Smr/MutS family protein [Nitrosomonas sp.]